MRLRSPLRAGVSGLAALIALSACSSARLPTGTDVGQVARDIVGVDLDGLAFRLGDYRGKVILLDFWGDW